MRSRYVAYAMGLDAYILDTWHPSTRPVRIEHGPASRPKWIGLAIVRARASGDEGEVEFVARCRIGGRADKLHETSRFRREGERWYYLGGNIE
ncbi:MAG: zinc chelation protein SecC [Rhodocyclaceae bacterium]|nr:zinc chelation protein SecC [Rhodocyclaceae bacterium]